jgi:hypothetical protein
VFVTGCHRSGTSLLAGILHGLGDGVHSLASDHLEAQLENPLGFFETRRLVELNDQLLLRVGAYWNQPPLLLPVWSSSPLFETLVPLRASLSAYALSQNWVDKDPRLCLTYPAFQHLLLKRVPLVVSLRQPLDVATSLYARNGFPLEAGLAIWYLYNHHLSSFIDEEDLLFDYNQLLSLRQEADVSLQAYRTIASLLERQNCSRPTLSGWDQVLADLLRPELNRASLSMPRRLSADLTPGLLRVCSLAMSRCLSGDRSVAAFQEAFADLPRPVLESVQRYALFPQLASAPQPSDQLSDLEMMRADLAASQALVQGLRHRLEALQSSRAWRFTAPLRLWKDRLIHRASG